MNFASLDKKNTCFAKQQDITLPTSGEYGFHDVMITGLQQAQSKLVASHPLELSEKHYAGKNEAMDFANLRKIQGIHAPLRLKMERLAVAKVQHLPCLPSSNVLLDTLMGNDDILEFGDILNTHEFSETMTDPHILMEAQLNIL
ncbi:proteasome maturation protein [Octopus bimaculoides]|uniref:Proteasome maturation protein n=1 Tax=Octopus bimaculoides TaxID=37653 RepID=A0A0L8GCI7_OCTBM|nr:proteasome maturation protein [Octopus bimaculoides]|eukprot:XP_014782188.1 PREDICTED: proteasome maturation protein-like [Octopus bimaculoides]